MEDFTFAFFYSCTCIKTKLRYTIQCW